MKPPKDICRAPRNRTLTLTEQERLGFLPKLIRLSGPVEFDGIQNRTISQNLTDVLGWLPAQFVDLLFLDPPYNLTKTYNGSTFSRQATGEYGTWFESWFVPLLKTLKSSASVYVCADWRSSGVVQSMLETHLKVRSRITWEREKGRGARTNWKNCTEDIWFGTVSDDYHFNVDAVKLRRRVIAPYRDSEGRPKDWTATPVGATRDTHPSNVWTDMTVPFWSMPENTDHPTQKPEKLLAKIILASSPPDGVVLDPFLGSGTTSVVAKKLGRRYVGIEQDADYCCLAEKRLALAERAHTIQGYAGGVFWERNSAPAARSTPLYRQPADMPLMFDARAKEPHDGKK
ncbi:MAG: site-specific DNA-methyltransferase [candidate division WOR-3 bacterium]|nr:site-specific DNA-methyltransferase [candidate division WOR-3 bacterium]